MYRSRFEEKTEIEKAVYRLKLLGFFRSYSVEYDSLAGGGTFVIDAKKFDRDEIIDNYIDYIRTYQDDDHYAETAKSTLTEAVKDLDGRDFIIEVVETLLTKFTYEVVEEGRRKAISKMLETANSAAACNNRDDADAEFRRLLLAYLHTGQVRRQEVRAASGCHQQRDRHQLAEPGDKSQPHKEKRDNLLGETDRLLEAYPQHYGLHYIQASVYMSVGEYSKMVDAIAAAAKFGTQSYGLDESRVQRDLVSILNSKDAEGDRCGDMEQHRPSNQRGAFADRSGAVCRSEQRSKRRLAGR